MKAGFRIPAEPGQAAKLIKAALKAEVAYRRGRYTESSEQELYISQAAEWLTSDDRQFGLLICGRCGNGKTTLMKAICTAVNILGLKDAYGEDWCVTQVSAKELARMSKQRETQDKYRSLMKARMLALDDMGFEPGEVLDYGNVVNPVVDLMEHRYEEQLFTIATTNLTPEQVKEKYGERIADRFNEMMRKIIFTNGSFR